MAVAEMENQRRQELRLGVGTASVICTSAGRVISALGKALDYERFGFLGYAGILSAHEYIWCEAVTFPLQSSYLVLTIAKALSRNSGDYHDVL